MARSPIGGSDAINRALWNTLRPQGDPLPVTVRAAPTVTEIEDSDGLVNVSVSAYEDGVDVRIHDLQVIVKKQRVVVLQQHPPYPIQRWTILFEGEIE